MSKSLPILLILFSSLSLFTLALNPALQNNYFFVPADNHLSYELYQTRSGIIAHSIEPADEKNYTSRYVLIQVDKKDAFPILTNLVSACDNLNPTFQSLHYHNETDSLVYYCARNTTLLILDPLSRTVQTTISLNLSTSLPIAKLSSDGMNVVVLLMDTLFIQSPQNSVLFKIDLQTKTISTQISFNQSLTTGEAVVAYAAGNNSAYIATNLVQGNDLTTTVYSIIAMNNTYQLNKVTNFSSSIMPFQIITKLFCLEDYVAVTSGVYLNFVNQQGTAVISTQIKIKPINGPNSGLLQPTVTAQYGDANLYALSASFRLGIYSVVNGAIQSRELTDTYGDFQVAFGNSGDLLFTLDYYKLFFSVLDSETLQPVYQAVSGYADIIVTDSTYAVVQGADVDLSSYSVYIFDLKTGAFLMKVPLGTKNYYYDKDQYIITFLNTTQMASGCTISHIDIVSGKNWTTLSFPDGDTICSTSFIASARITDKGNPEAAFRLVDQYVIISETLGRLTFPVASDTDSINVNFYNLYLTYLNANQTTNQLTASVYAFNALTENFTLVRTNTLDNRPVENHGLFVLNQSATVALSNNTFAIINSLNSVSSEDSFSNNYNLVTTFTDNLRTQWMFFGYNNSTLINSGGPVLFSSNYGFFVIPGKRTNTVNGRATGSFSFCLHDDLYSTIRLVRLYSSDSNQKIISI